MKFFRFLLFPFSILYDVITRLRNFLYDKNFIKHTSFNIPIIAVGNLSVGGTGKTPQIEYLIRLLKDNYKIAILSRGYGRKTKGFIELKKDHLVKEVGDEPLQFYKKFGDQVIVAVDENRVNGIKKLLKRKIKPNVILLDDAFQHRKIKAKTYLLLTKYNDLYVDDFILPTGNLRESKNSSKRADYIIITKCPSNLSLSFREKIRLRIKAKKNQKIFFTKINYNEKLKGKEKTDIKKIKNTKVLLVTGIANPKPLLEYLLINKIDFVHINFPDHHYFTKKDINNIKTKYINLPENNKIILTTEKDYIRLLDKIQNLYFIEIKIDFIEHGIKFNNSIKSLIKNNYVILVLLLIRFIQQYFVIT